LRPIANSCPSGLASRSIVRPHLVKTPRNAETSRLLRHFARSLKCYRRPCVLFYSTMRSSPLTLSMTDSFPYQCEHLAETQWPNTYDTVNSCMSTESLQTKASSGCLMCSVVPATVQTFPNPQTATAFISQRSRLFQDGRKVFCSNGPFGLPSFGSGRQSDFCIFHRYRRGGGDEATSILWIHGI